MINISQLFAHFSESVQEFYSRANLGFYIPLYQREYSWDKDNVEQLLQDIGNGVDNLLEDDKEIRFMGTIIRIRETNPKVNVQPQDLRALPDSIFNIIDGQQRISTIALLGCVLYEELNNLEKKLPKQPLYDELREDIHAKLSKLPELFSLDLGRGKPSLKPVIIRGSVDSWTLTGSDEENYRSPVAKYLAGCITAINEQTKLPTPPTKTKVSTNIRLMKSYLRKTRLAHEEPDPEYPFPPAWEILERINQNYIWSYERPEFVPLINSGKDNPSKESDTLCSLVQVLTFSHYLLRRCCFTIIDPTSEDWAFDMFQSLNATGTPLTSIETFKPLVVNTINKHDGGFKNSNSETYFQKIDHLFDMERSASKKSKLSNEFLTTFALSYNAYSLPKQFSRQRKWLNTQYNDCGSASKREEFVRIMGDLAIYTKNLLTFDPLVSMALPHLNTVSKEEQELATFCVLYLRDSSHKMANTILSRFYAYVLRGEAHAVADFISASKAICAFYTLWRSASSNSGLDNVYRQILRDTAPHGVMSWQGDKRDFTASNLKQYFREALDIKLIGSKDSWLNKATQYFRADNAKPVCRFALFVTANDTEPDPAHPSLMIPTTKSSTKNYLTPEHWRSAQYRTIEHIAPQKPITSDWQSKNALYETDMYQFIGNLTLLPSRVNTSVSNREWKGKWLYYQHLSETDTDRLNKLKDMAEFHGINLSKDALDLLQKTPHNNHIKPIAKVGVNGNWNDELVKMRSHRICEILWDRMIDWLQ